MRTSSRLESQRDLVVYPTFIRMERKKLLGLSIVMLIFVIIGCWMIVVRNSSDTWKGWLGVIFFSLCLLVFLMQFTWGPLLVVNEQGIYVRNNPLLKSIMLLWQEIATITLFTKKRNTYLGFSLAPVHLEAFLQRQSPL